MADCIRWQNFHPFIVELHAPLLMYRFVIHGFFRDCMGQGFAMTHYPTAPRLVLKLVVFKAREHGKIRRWVILDRCLSRL